MQNLAIFHESNKDAAYYRQQVSERGILEKIDAFNEGLLEIEGVTMENLPLVYEVLNEVEISLNKNANDPRTRMALQNFTIDNEKAEEKAATTEDDNTEGLTEETQELTGEQTGNSDPTENTEGLTEETQEPTTEPTGEPATEQQEPTSEPDPVENADTQEPATEPATEPTNETPQLKKSGRRKKDAE